MNYTFKKIKTLLAIQLAFLSMLVLPFVGLGQEKNANEEKGIHFQEGLSWTAIQARAKAENKYIFMDCFTTWCGPCKFMKNTIFPQEECGNYFNDKFISLEVQLDSIKADNEAVRNWYADAHAIMVKYNIRAFPTFLIFTPDGRVVHRIVGGNTVAKDFIVRVKDAFDPEKQYYTQLQKYNEGGRDSAFLRKLAGLALSAYDIPVAEPVAKAYFATQKDLFNPGSLELLKRFTSSTKDEGFAVFYHHAAEVDKILGAGVAEAKVRDILIQEYIYPTAFAKNGADPDWKALQGKIAGHFPELAEELTALGKVAYFEHKNDWNNFQMVVVEYMSKYGAAATPEQLNDYAYTVFLHCPDMHCVTEALDWSKRSFKDNQSPSFIDTYANILYKMGKKDDAIAWEQKARDLSAGEEKKGFQETIDKMSKGEKTWD